MIGERARVVLSNITAAARKAQRDPASVRLIAVSKFQPFEAVCEAYDAGLRAFGENFPQEMVAKAAAVAATGRTPQWHFIGRLQRNKVNTVLRAADVIHTLDREELLTTLAKRAEVSPLRVLVQVNIGREAQKGGIDPAEAVAFARHAARTSGITVLGLMAVPPAEQEPRPYFSQLAELLRQLQKTPEGHRANELSMGMSHDYLDAIDCGATLVRVGTALFGERQRRQETP